MLSMTNVIVSWSNICIHLTQYVCPRCRKKVAKARRRKLEAAKVLKAKAPKKDDALKETKAKASRKVDKAKGTVPSLSIKRYVPSKHLTEEEQKDEALQVALTDAQSRGLPAGWTCFYGVSLYTLIIINL
jgi:hypothetical protein